MRPTLTDLLTLSDHEFNRRFVTRIRLTREQIYDRLVPVEAIPKLEGGTRMPLKIRKQLSEWSMVDLGGRPQYGKKEKT